MAASHKLSQSVSSSKFSLSKSGVLTIRGFGIRVRVHSGHLEIEDGIGPERRKFRFARVGHGLKRIVLVSSDGFITLEALHWLSAQDVSLSMLERDGKVLCAAVGVLPVREQHSDRRYRRPPLR